MKVVCLYLRLSCQSHATRTSRLRELGETLYGKVTRASNGLSTAILPSSASLVSPTALPSPASLSSTALSQTRRCRCRGADPR